jgi:predicted nucleic acid-binding protein
MQLFDASSVIYAWDNYPIRQFPGLWGWMAEQIAEKKVVMPTVAFDEVDNKIPECAVWLRENHIEQFPVTNAIIQQALLIKHLLGIVGDNYHSKGVGENDIFIIATASVNNLGLVSDEGRQPKLSDIPSKRKIPAVCTMEEVGVPCMSFIEFIKRSEVVFG